MSKTKTARTGLSSQTIELLYQALETELGGVEIYRTALKCADNEELREEWEKYLRETEEHVEIVRSVVQELGLDPDADTPGRQICRHIGTALVKAMHMALGQSPHSAELVAAECVVHAETKDHLNWSLLAKLVEESDDDLEPVAAAVEKVEDEEDEHLYHSQGWSRELWVQALGLPAQLPPPEEEEDVHSEEEAGRAKSAGAPRN